MDKIEFKVSAKAARLIGRENITDADGAIIELIKNSYDADAECVCCLFDLVYPTIPNTITQKKYLTFEPFDQQQLGDYYLYNEEEKLWERNLFNDKANNSLSQIFYKYNKIIIIDNGTGMTLDTVMNSWMQIGTSDKEYNYTTTKGRIKTGAKGIGRFALDKLSYKSQMYTKANGEDGVYWNIDWEQFTNAKLLNQVCANVSKIYKPFSDIVKEITGDYFENLSNYNWQTGTIIILSPTREPWTETQFRKINSAIKSLNPFNTVDKFEVFIKNNTNAKYNYTTENISLTSEDYDYKVCSEFDGINNFVIRLYRNELDTQLKEIYYNYSSSISTLLNMDDFWNRPALKSDIYCKEMYYTERIIQFDLENVLDKDSLITLKNLGPFTFDFLFTKMQNSSEYPGIIKRIPVNKRKNLYNQFSGIRIYRDKFKVRPYGEKDSALYDWLGMGIRSQKSPAPISHPHGKWRVLPYQTLGNVIIGRDKNPLLIDMANREGLVQNDQYDLLVKLCQMVLDLFEFDRQYYYRELSQWVKENNPKTTKNIIDSIIDEEKNNPKTEQAKQHCNEDDTYSATDYKNAILHLFNENTEKIKTLDVLMAFCASGILANTFAHELAQIHTNFGTRNNQLKLCIDYILGYCEFSGDDDFNPYLAIQESEKNDNLLSSWIGILMNGFNPGYEEDDLREYNLIEELNNIIGVWQPLLKEKFILLNNIVADDITCNIPIIDWYIILNNFILNSVWFLEIDSAEKDKEIIIKVYTEENTINIELSNNGPLISEKYKNTPNMIFVAGESSKIVDETTNKTGTGIGLWITKTIVDKNQGSITVLDLNDGFGLKINIPRS